MAENSGDWGGYTIRLKKMFAMEIPFMIYCHERGFFIMKILNLEKITYVRLYPGHLSVWFEGGHQEIFDKDDAKDILKAMRDKSVEELKHFLWLD